VITPMRTTTHDNCHLLLTVLAGDRYSTQPTGHREIDLEGLGYYSREIPLADLRHLPRPGDYLDLWTLEGHPTTMAGHMPPEVYSRTWTADWPPSRSERRC
jgi:hypothetical protein